MQRQTVCVLYSAALPRVCVAVAVAKKKNRLQVPNRSSHNSLRSRSRRPIRKDSGCLGRGEHMKEKKVQRETGREKEKAKMQERSGGAGCISPPADRTTGCFPFFLFGSRAENERLIGKEVSWNRRCLEISRYYRRCDHPLWSCLRASYHSTIGCLKVRLRGTRG